MKTFFEGGEGPRHLFEIRELDFSGDLFAAPFAGQWFRLAAWPITPQRDEHGVEDVVSLAVPLGGGLDPALRRPAPFS